MNNLVSLNCTSPHSAKWEVTVAGASLITISLLAWGILLTLYLSGVFPPNISASCLLAPEVAGAFVGAVVLGVAFYLNEPLEKEISLTELIQGHSGEGIGSKISAHWLKDAATRIFPDPLRSFLELIVNGLDASLPPEKGVGKFGMGFLSILTFLDHAETEGCTLELETTYQKEGTFFSYSMDIHRLNESYGVKLKQLPPKEGAGTTMTLKPKRGEFSEETIGALLHYCNALQFYEHGKIEVLLDGNQTLTIGEGEETLAWVVLQKNQLSVQDHGCGISLDVAYNQLFVPSASTKVAYTLAEECPTFCEFKPLLNKQDNKGHFLIAISGVIVIDLPVEGEIKEDLLIRMPPGARLTLGRNALEFNETHPESLLYLKRVIREMVDQALIPTEEGAKKLLALYNGLKTWEAHTPSVKKLKLSNYLENRVQKGLKQNPSLIPYPYENEGILKPILPRVDGAHFIPLPSILANENFALFENFLAEHARISSQSELEFMGLEMELIQGKKVLFIEDDLLPKVAGRSVAKVSSLGMRSLIFAPRSLLMKEGVTKKSLNFALCSRFADYGKRITPYRPSRGRAVNPVITKLRSPRRFFFLTGKDSDPEFYSSISLREAIKENLFGNVKDEIFEALAPKIDQNQFPIVHFRNYDRLLPCLGNIILFSEADFLGLMILYEDSQFWLIEDAETLSSHKPKNFAAAKEMGLFKPIAPSMAMRLAFECLFANYGVSQAGGEIFTVDQTIWPPQEEITENYLLNALRCISNTILCWNERDQPHAFATTQFKGFQEDTWIALESFLDYIGGERVAEHILPLLLLHERVLENERLADPLKEKFAGVVEKILAGYHRFLTFKPGDLQGHYGQPQSADFRHPEDQDEFCCTLAEAVDLLNSLAEKPALFEKMLDLINEEMLSQLDTERRNEHFKRDHVVRIRDILFSNGFALLGKAKGKGINMAYIETILENVRTPLELNLMSILLLTREGKKALRSKIGQDKEKFSLILKEIIRVYLQEKMDAPAVQYHYDYQFFHKSINVAAATDLRSVFEPIFVYLRNLEAGAFDVERISTSRKVFERLKTSTNFTTLQIIQATQHEKDFEMALQQNDLPTLIELFSEQSSDSSLQMVTQAVEHGSERDCLEASLTEALQNSLDAIRGFLKKNPETEKKRSKIVFDVKLIQEGDATAPRLVATIRDFIGMESLKTLLCDFPIPNYSEKKEDDESVGEMGNGSFQMYRDAEAVFVKTRTLENPSRIYLLKVVPIRKNNEVVDLEHTCIDITDLEPEFQGTELKIVFQNKDAAPRIAVEMAGVALLGFIRQTLGCASPPMPAGTKLRLELNHREGAIPFSEIDKSPPFQIAATPFSALKMKNSSAQGYVLTNGYPFKSLSTFLIEEKLLPESVAREFARGWCLNLPKGTYSPVQSRTRVQLSAEVREELKFFLAEWVYFATFDSPQLYGDYYPHLKSSASNFSQVFPGEKSFAMTNEKLIEAVTKKGSFAELAKFITYYQPSFLSKSFLKHIEAGYKTLIPELLEHKKELERSLEKEVSAENKKERYALLQTVFENSCLDSFDDWKSKLVPITPLEKQFFQTIVIPWFEVKTFSFSKNVPKLESLEEKNPHLMSKEEVESKKGAAAMCHAFLQNELEPNKLVETATYILRSYCELYAKFHGLKTPDIATTFFYDADEMAIAAYSAKQNTIHINLARISFTSILEAARRVIKRKPLKDNPLFSISLTKSGTLNHELEHARRAESCEKDNFHAFDYDLEGRYLDFESCASSMAHNALQCGLMERWAEKLDLLTLPSKEQLGSLRKLESEQPTQFNNIILTK